MVEVAALLTPALILYLLFVMLPVVQAVYYSLFHWNGLEPLNRFIGLANYQRALGDPVFMRHAKAGELCERFNALYFVSQGKIAGEAPTYRGEGMCFL